MKYALLSLCQPLTPFIICRLNRVRFQSCLELARPCKLAKVCDFFHDSQWPVTEVFILNFQEIVLTETLPSCFHGIKAHLPLYTCKGYKRPIISFPFLHVCRT